jgi:hypothetical protein
MKNLNLNQFALNKDVSGLNINETSLRYVKLLEGVSLYMLGLIPEPGAVLINTKNTHNLFKNCNRYELDTLHDYCLFAKGTDEFHKKQAEELQKELNEKGLYAPKPDEIHWVYGHSYPGSKSFVFCLDGQLIFT